MQLQLAATKAETRAGCVQSLVRALGLLDQLADGEGLTLTEVARRARLPRSTVHRLLTTMETMHYVAFDTATNQWIVGGRAMAFGARSGPREIARLARPVLSSLQCGARATASLGTADGRQVLYAGQSRLPDDRWPPARAGDRLPLHTTAVGKAILAFWPAERLAGYLDADILEARTEASIVSPEKLRRELELVRVRGYAIDDQETRAGLRCVAAAVIDRNGEPRAAVGVSCPLQEVPEARISALGATVQMSARRLAEGFGFAAAA